MTLKRVKAGGSSPPSSPTDSLDFVVEENGKMVCGRFVRNQHSYFFVLLLYLECNTVVCPLLKGNVHDISLFPELH